MTITSAAGVEFARELGAQLVVLARENSIAEIATIRAAQTSPADVMPLEVFVHGALCVAYSGQCLTSESLGGRSANRGECAQACRLPYDLIADGRKIDLGDRRYLLSPQDLAGLDVLPELVRVGVSSLKIEGRLKSPEYVASITRVYRQALDRLWPEKAETGENQPSPHYELQMAFSRGLYTGWFRGIHNQELAHARFGTKRGVLLGEVTRVGTASASLRLMRPLAIRACLLESRPTPAMSESARCSAPIVWVNCEKAMIGVPGCALSRPRSASLTRSAPIWSLSRYIANPPFW